MQHMNRLVYEASAVNRYATFFFAIYDPSERVLKYVNAGHNPPVMLRAGARILLEAGGPVVGLLQDVRYEEQSLALEAGDLLLAYTDGISEAMTAEDEEWGEERILLAAESARHKSAANVLSAISPPPIASRAMRHSTTT
jgi:phosphoserine phosphatase RsbU/P